MFEKALMIGANQRHLDFGSSAWIPMQGNEEREIPRADIDMPELPIEPSRLAARLAQPVSVRAVATDRRSCLSSAFNIFPTGLPGGTPNVEFKEPQRPPAVRVGNEPARGLSCSRKSITIGDGA